MRNWVPALSLQAGKIRCELDLSAYETYKLSWALESSSGKFKCAGTGYDSAIEFAVGTLPDDETIRCTATLEGLFGTTQQFTQSVRLRDLRTPATAELDCTLQ